MTDLQMLQYIFSKVDADFGEPEEEDGKMFFRVFGDYCQARFNFDENGELTKDFHMGP